MLEKINRREKYELYINTKSWIGEKIQHIIDITWNKYIAWNPFLKDVISIDDSDSWSCDYTLSKVIVPVLEQLKKNKNGYGYIEDSDVPFELRTGNSEHNEDKYNWVLDEVIWCLREIANEEPNSPPIGDINIDFATMDVPDTWMIEQEEYEKRLQNGCRLFGRYLRTFWD